MRIDSVRPAVLSTTRKPRNRIGKSTKNRWGWAMDGEQSYSVGGGYTSVWASSIAFAAPLAVLSEQQVWNSSGNREHIGIVTRVDETLAHAGGTVSQRSVT